MKNVVTRGVVIYAIYISTTRGENPRIFPKQNAIFLTGEDERTHLANGYQELTFQYRQGGVILLNGSQDLSRDYSSDLLVKK